MLKPPAISWFSSFRAEPVMFFPESMLELGEGRCSCRVGRRSLLSVLSSDTGRRGSFFCRFGGFEQWDND